MAWDQTTNATLGYGVLLSISIDSGSTYKKVAEVRSISGLGATAEVNDTTHTESPDSYREYIGGLKDGAEFTADLNFFPATLSDTNYVDQETLFGYLGSRYDFKVTWADSGTTEWTFKGVITRFDCAFDSPGAEVSASIAIKIAGAMDLSA
jgi:predicted secreted protein